MLTAARNELLTRVSAGTPMGELLRRYWQPIAGASELESNPVKPVRLLGEDLVLYRDGGGRYGLIDRHCPHRRADMSYGWVEHKGIRCSYHGWLMDETGSCIEQPYEDTANPKPSRAGCDAKAYPVEGVRRPSLRLSRPGARAGTAEMGAVHLGQRLSRDRARGRSVQLVSVPGKLHRSGALRVDARQLERPAAGSRQPMRRPST